MPLAPTSTWGERPWPLPGEEKVLGWAGAYLGRVVQVKRLVEAEVDEPQQGSVELGEGGHNPVVHVCWVLGTQRRISSVSAKMALTTHVGWGLQVPKDQELLQGGPAFGALPQEKRLCGMAQEHSGHQ